MDSVNSDRPTREEEVGTTLAVHIVGLSAGLVGVCLTVIGVIHVGLHIDRWNTAADNVLAGDAVLFLLTCLLAYASLRTPRRERRRRLERLADSSFMFALTIMTLVCTVIAFEIF